MGHCSVYSSLKVDLDLPEMICGPNVQQVYSLACITNNHRSGLEHIEALKIIHML